MKLNITPSFIDCFFISKLNLAALACTKEEIDLHIQTTYPWYNHFHPSRTLTAGSHSWKIFRRLWGGQDLVQLLALAECLTRSVRTVPLLKWLRKTWKSTAVAICWRSLEENSKNINQFRMISLLNVEGKIFFSIVARRLTDYLSQQRIHPSAEGRHSWSCLKQASGDPAHQRNPGEQGRPGGALAWPERCPWVLPIQTGPNQQCGNQQQQMILPHHPDGPLCESWKAAAKNCRS